VRIAADLVAEKLMDAPVRAFDITGRPMKGWFMVGKGSWGKKAEMIRWLNIGRSYALSLPRKTKKKKSLEEIYYQDRR